MCGMIESVCWKMVDQCVSPETLQLLKPCVHFRAVVLLTAMAVFRFMCVLFSLVMGISIVQAETKTTDGCDDGCQLKSVHSSALLQMESRGMQKQESFLHHSLAWHVRSRVETNPHLMLLGAQEAGIKLKPDDTAWIWKKPTLQLMASPPSLNTLARADIYEQLSRLTEDNLHDVYTSMATATAAVVDRLAQKKIFIHQFASEIGRAVRRVVEAVRYLSERLKRILAVANPAAGIFAAFLLPFFGGVLGIVDEKPLCYRCVSKKSQYVTVTEVWYEKVISDMRHLITSLKCWKHHTSLAPVFTLLPFWVLRTVTQQGRAHL